MTSELPEPDIASSVWIARTPEYIWNYVVQVSTDTEWRDDVTNAQWISEPPHGIGSTGLHIIKGVGDWPWKATTIEEPRIMAWDVTGGRFEGSHGAYRIDPDGEGSRFTIETRLKRSVILNLLKLVLKGRIVRQNAMDLENLKAIMEA